MQIRDRVRELRRVRAGDLTPNPKNWRTHPKAQADALRGILAEVGYADALLARELPDGSLILVDGHLRAETTPEQEVPVLVLDIDEAEADKLLLSIDPLAALAETNAVALDALLREVDTGSEGLQQMYADLAEAADLYQDDKEVVEDEVPEPPVDPITKPGDLWLLGDHRLLCGDSTKTDDVERLMAGKTADAVVTDPPYGIGFSYDTHDDDRDAWFQLMNKVVPMLRSMARFVVMPSCGIDRIGWWYKHHEPDWMMCWYKGSPGHLSKVGFNDWESHLVWGRPPKQMHDYWQTKCGFHVDGHPCPKPVEYSAWLVERAVERDGLIYEPFCGSGTTLIAAEQLGRKCHGMEISPAYCDVIVKRWETLTGKKATREEAPSGKTRTA
jgi:DNA modification methylase